MIQYAKGKKNRRECAKISDRKLYQNKKILALIPARKGSKRIPNKNIIDLAGKPLIGYTIEAALASKCFLDIVVSSDDEEIITTALHYGAIAPFIRPKDLADDLSKSIDVVIHAIQTLEKMGKTYDILVLLQPTSPLRDKYDIKNCIDYFINHEIKSIVSVSSRTSGNQLLMREMDNTNRIIKKNNSIMESQRHENTVNYYYVNGAIYINYIKDIMPNTKMSDNDYGFIMSEEHGIDIDEYRDLQIASKYIIR